MAVESSNPEHRRQAEVLLDRVLAAQAESMSKTKTVRVGITGSPGVGKSTFIEALGLHLVDQGHKVAVIAIGAR